MPTNSQLSISQEYKQTQALIDELEPVNILTEMVFKFLKEMDNTSSLKDKPKNHVYLQVIVWMFGYLSKNLDQEMQLGISDFMNEPDGAQMVAKAKHVLDQMPQLQPIAIRQLATDLPTLLHIQDQDQAGIVFSQLINFANSLESK